jgi:hypothetical protein
MRRRVLYLFFASVTLAIFYLVLGINLQHLGYYNHEALFYVEKARIVFQGTGNRLKTIGLTSPILPFYGMLPFTYINWLVAPIIASALGTAFLFFVISLGVIKTTRDNFLILVLLLLFIFHPGLIYVGCSGKGIYLILLFFFMFFYNIFRFYISNTTFHISIASILLVILLFCDYRFIWMTLFFIPLIISISIQSLNLAEKQSIFRLFLSFNNPSLRRKLVNKTFALYIIIFILPIIAMMCYKLLNQAHANDFNYFIDSPYSTWSVLVEKFENQISPAVDNYNIPEVSFLTSVRILIFCPLIILGAYLFRQNTQHFLTMLIPFGLVEFLKIHYENTFLPQQYYLIFIIISFLGLIFKSQIIARRKIYKVIIILIVIAQVFSGYFYLRDSFIQSEKNFVTIFQKKPTQTTVFDEYKDMADYINHLPKKTAVLVDDVNAYPIIAFVKDIKNITLPYQEAYLSAIENPTTYVSYVLLANDANSVGGFTQLNFKYKSIMELRNNIRMDKVFESENWAIYRLR